MSGEVTRAFAIAGGLHHAHRDRASGFCVYNDLAVGHRLDARGATAPGSSTSTTTPTTATACRGSSTTTPTCSPSPPRVGALPLPRHRLRGRAGRRRGLRLLAEPADGALHRGRLLARASTRDLLPEVAAAFRPDVIVLQNGCDAHVLDPLTHLRCTTRLYERDGADHRRGGRPVLRRPRSWPRAAAATPSGASCRAPGRWSGPRSPGRASPRRIPRDWLRALAGREPRTCSPTSCCDDPGRLPPVPRRARDRGDEPPHPRLPPPQRPAPAARLEHGVLTMTATRWRPAPDAGREYRRPRDKDGRPLPRAPLPPRTTAPALEAFYDAFEPKRAAQGLPPKGARPRGALARLRPRRGGIHLVVRGATS